jgi:hypothetical protein
MGDEFPPWVFETKSALEAVISKPKMIEKYLARPPFKYLHEIISSVSKTTGYASGLFSAEEETADGIAVNMEYLSTLTIRTKRQRLNTSKKSCLK